MILGKIQCFKPKFFFLFFLVENQTSLIPPPFGGKFHYFFSSFWTLPLVDNKLSLLVFSIYFKLINLS